MKFKLDENLGIRTQKLFQAAGHDVHTILDEQLSGATDKTLYEVCCDEKRCLVTLDLDFSDVLRFPPKPTGGIAVIRVPRNPDLSLLEQLTSQLLKMTERISIEGKLWIVELDRIRIHQSDEEFDN